MRETWFLARAPAFIHDMSGFTEAVLLGQIEPPVGDSTRWRDLIAGPALFA